MSAITTSRPLTGTCWAQVVPVYSYYGATPWKVRIAKITQRKPRNPQPGCLLIKINITVPMAAFVPTEFALPLTVAEGDGELVPAVTVEAGHDGG